MSLVLTRRSGEVLCIGENVTVRVVSTTANCVKLAIDAPKNVRIDREEIRISKDER